MTKITLLHTSDAHVPTFKALQDRLAPEAILVQIVRKDWLKQAQKHGVRDKLRRDVAATVDAAEGTVICTCTTIGAAAAKAGAIRVDAPMMDQAARIGGPVLMVYALKSTETPSTELLEAAFHAQGKDAEIRALFCGEFWPLFEAGEHEAFAACIAGAVRHALTEEPAACVALAQASMAGAAVLLSALDIPVLTSPEQAMLTVLNKT